MTSAPRPRLRLGRRAVLLSKLLLVAGGCCIVLAGIEVYFRFHQDPATWPLTWDASDRLGWRLKPNYRREYSTRDQTGAEYPLVTTTDRHGFKLFGDPQSARQKIFIIGDSFTEAFNLSSDSSYAAVLRDELPAEVFSCGVGGYGTLQELMVLDEYFDEIRPDLVLWQFCYNDFINNSRELELRSTANHIAFARPYLMPDGRIISTSPTRFPALRDWVNRHSRAGFFIWGRLDRLGARSHDSIEDEITARGADHPDFRAAVPLTARLLALVRRRCGTCPVALFVSERAEPYYTEVRRLAGENGFRFLAGVPEVVAAAAAAGQPVFHEDGGHWNERGHQLVGEELARQLRTDPPPGRR